MTRINWIRLLPWIAVVLMGLYIAVFERKADESVIVPPVSGGVVIDNPTPINEVVHDTVTKDSIVYRPKIVQVQNPTNTELIARFKAAQAENDSLRELLMYKSAVKNREYLEQLNDSNVVISVRSYVQGKLLRQGISYVTKEKKIAVRQNKQHLSVYAGGGLGSDGKRLDAIGGVSVVDNKKGRIYSLDFATDKSIMVTTKFKLW